MLVVLGSPELGMLAATLPAIPDGLLIPDVTDVPLLPVDEMDLVALDREMLPAAGISTLGMLAGTSLETEIMDISCLPPFFLAMETDGIPDPAVVPARSMDTLSSVRSIRSRLLYVDEVALSGSSDVRSSCRVPGLRFPRELISSVPSTGLVERLIMPAGSSCRPERTALERSVSMVMVGKRVLSALRETL